MQRICYDRLMRTLKIFLGVCLLGLASFVVACYVSPQVFLKTTYAFVKSEFPDLPEFSNRSLYELTHDKRADYIVVDVRTPQERNVSIIAGAIDNAYFERNLASYQNKKIIVYCTIGYRSGYYASELRQKGFDAYNLSEGILGWTHVDGLLVDPQGQATSQVHVYSRPWNLALKNHIAVF
jgi:rhodanese-related sulfurtransferase